MNRQYLQLLLQDICNLLNVEVSDVQSPKVQRSLNFARYLFSHFARHYSMMITNDIIAEVLQRREGNIASFCESHRRWLHRTEYADLYFQMQQRVEKLKEQKKQAA